MAMAFAISPGTVFGFVPRTSRPVTPSERTPLRKRGPFGGIESVPRPRLRSETAVYVAEEFGVVSLAAMFGGIFCHHLRGSLLRLYPRMTLKAQSAIDVLAGIGGGAVGVMGTIFALEIKKQSTIQRREVGAQCLMV